MKNSSCNSIMKYVNLPLIFQVVKIVFNIVVLVFQILLLVSSNQSTTQRACDISTANTTIFGPTTYALILQHWYSMQHWQPSAAVSKLCITCNLTEPWKRPELPFEIRTRKIKISTAVCKVSVLAGSTNIQSHFHRLQMCNICKTSLLYNDTFYQSLQLLQITVGEVNCYK